MPTAVCTEPFPSSKPLPGPPEQGYAGLGDGIQLPKPQPGSGGSFALEGTIKEHFALQLKSLIKICKHVNGEGKKGSAQFSPFAIAFLLNSQLIPGACGRSVGRLDVPSCLPVQGRLHWEQPAWRA